MAKLKFMATKKTKDLRRRTIAIELLNQWHALKRDGDSEKIAKLLELSKPTVDKALIYGGVHQQRIIDEINKFFADRLTKEKEDANRLKDLAIN